MPSAGFEPAIPVTKRLQALDLTATRTGATTFTYTNFNGPLLLFVGPDSSVGIATGYGLDGPGIESRWGRDFPHLSRPALGARPASCTLGTGSFPGVKSGRGVKLAPNSLLVPWLWKGKAIPLLPLWDVRPVQSLSACTRVTFTFTFFYFF